MPLTKKQILTGKYKTTSNIPKTEKQKANWKAARAIVAKESGKYSDKSTPFGLVTKIYENAEKAGKQIKKSDAKKTKYSKTVAKYKSNATKKK